MAHKIVVESAALQQGASALDGISRNSSASAEKIQAAVNVASFSVAAGQAALDQLQSQVVSVIGQLMSLAGRLKARADEAAAFQARDVLTLGLADNFKAADLYAEANRAYRRADVFNELLSQISSAKGTLSQAASGPRSANDANIAGTVGAGAFFTAGWANTLRDFDAAIGDADGKGAAQIEKAFIKRTWFPMLPASVTGEVILNDAFLHSGVWGIARQLTVQLHGDDVSNAQINDVFQQLLTANGLTAESAERLADGTRLTIPADLQAALGRANPGELAVDGVKKIPEIVDNFTGNLDNIVRGALGGANGVGVGGTAAVVAIAVTGGLAAGAFTGGGSAAGSTALVPLGSEGGSAAVVTGSVGPVGGGSAGAGATSGASAGAGAGATSGASAGAGAASSGAAGSAATATGEFVQSSSGWVRSGMNVLRNRVDGSGNLWQKFADGWYQVSGPGTEAGPVSAAHYISF